MYELVVKLMCILICLDLMFTVICRNLTKPVNGTVTYSDPTIPRDEGSTATYSCNTGNILVGNSERTCLVSGWNGHDPQCKGKDRLHTVY